MGDVELNAYPSLGIANCRFDRFRQLTPNSENACVIEWITNLHLGDEVFWRALKLLKLMSQREGMRSAVVLTLLLRQLRQLCTST